MRTARLCKLLITNDRYTYDDMYAKLDLFLMLNRITEEEYDAVLSYLYLLELDHGYTQDFSAASADYIPEFNLEGL